jgi:hypothetical protein
VVVINRYGNSAQPLSKKNGKCSRCEGITLENPLSGNECTINSCTVKNETFMSLAYQDKERKRLAAVVHKA